MKVVEVKEDIRDTSIVRDIFDIAKISQRINLYSEFIIDINYTDFQYIQVLLNKSKTMLEQNHNKFIIPAGDSSTETITQSETCDTLKSRSFA